MIKSFNWILSALVGLSSIAHAFTIINQTPKEFELSWVENKLQEKEADPLAGYFPTVENKVTLKIAPLSTQKVNLNSYKMKRFFLSVSEDIKAFRGTTGFEVIGKRTQYFNFELRMADGTLFDTNKNTLISHGADGFKYGTALNDWGLLLENVPAGKVYIPEDIPGSGYFGYDAKLLDKELVKGNV